ncbi:t-complex protein 1 beta SU (nucleomorph) [Chroomonas mesostigmatica CCMP1168]|uniref:CCT-beta n=1 Tax=Chroomonas mesostigmatica CCMP1168 TaxID=1195612 RepID=J7G6F0_9CRYP|nr:t-complex protein 1 beta SU [Chroomonas mesostigmatica CCMP1168]|mmetsp:Transcript_58803/g.144127  ORF Transcript_58803/g.144127 Transcript_58803/m.144127 type:complete len:506 (+) Transcript_58803:142-1659(+)
MEVNEKRLFMYHEVKKIVNFVKSTLGPKGMDKILFSKTGEIKVTNDGSTILKNAFSNSLALNIIRDICNVQDDEIGDGTTSVCCLIGELISEAEKLILLRIHPQIIIKGFRIAAKESLRIMEISSFDHSSNLGLFCSELLDVARTTLNSKIIFPFREHFGRIAVKAVLKLKGSTNVNQIQIIKRRGGSLRDSFLEEGFILEKKAGLNQPKKIKDAKILIANTSMDSDKIKIYGAKIRVKTLSKLAELEVGEQKKILDKCKKIISHGINVFINRQLIYNRHERFFTEHGILTIEHADFDGIERLSLATGAEIVSTFDHPSKIKLGKCKNVEEILIGEETMIRFGGCLNGDICSIILRGSNCQILDEAERSLHDALCVLSQVIRDPRLVFGGGCIETQISVAIEKFSKKIPGKIGTVMESFSKAIQNLPKIIADNAGLDSSDIINKLRIFHEKGYSSSCFDINNGDIKKASSLGLTECFRLKNQTIISAVEAAEMIIRIDNIFRRTT